MGCQNSKPQAKYEVKEERPRAVQTPKAVAPSAPSKSAPSKSRGGLDKHFNFKRDINSTYEIFHGCTLGRGAFGVVKECRRRDAPSESDICAVKIIYKNKLETAEDVQDLRIEVDCMNRLGTGSLNCISLFDTYEDDSAVYLVMEIATGGELYDRIKKGAYTEAMCADVSKSILQMIAQCHAKHIVYRDIKPNNFLFFTKSLTSPLKGTDFGLSVHHPPGSKPLQDTTGTPFYMAPEVIRQKYSYECDLWSTGALIYQLLCGRVPFPPNPNLSGRRVVIDLFQRILNSPIDMESDPWPKISPEAKDLVGGLLQRDVKKRLTIDQALGHPWLQAGIAPEEPLADDVVQRLQRYGTYGRFRQQAMVAALEKVKQSNGELALPWTGHQEKLREMFQEMDKDKNGELSYDEIKVGLKDAGYSLADSEVTKLFGAVDVNNSGSIDVEEFLAAMMDWQKEQASMAPDCSLRMLEEEEEDPEAYANLWRELFDKYDRNGDGTISVDEIAVIMGVPEESPVILDVLREADLDTDGQIDFEEFKTMMSGSKSDKLEIYSKRKMDMSGKLEVEQE
eukprot:CAMPEP_0177756298 /NCGR_PEP_ID=MMETSP0491_2-20121128/3028_1 /TAXON_ID=63592 /ORGANISM="Tetraselmis chuii, Strain PLY429" /LENGTH=564 /DNA_ID=CAMNT_0019271859 /DNA_START=638 /DNA_END=2332 /DNA_ORIENTATION=+